MIRVLVVTKNILSEQRLQAALQRSNIEVYNTSDLLDEVEFHPQIVSYFSAVIFSETISTFEVSKYHSYFKNNGLLILRKGNKEDLLQSNFSYLESAIDEWIDFDFTEMDVVEKIIELIDKHPKLNMIKEENVRDSTGFFLKLSPKEKSFLYQIYQQQKVGKIVSREELCSLIWESEVTRSKICQLSNIATNIRKKLLIYNFSEKELVTNWRVGYTLSDFLFNEIKRYMD